MEKEKIDFQKIYEGLIPTIQAANKGITHRQFAEGAKNGTMGFKVMIGEPADLIKGAKKTAFNLHVLLYMYAPLIIVPLLAYHADNWWLLFGIALSPLFAHFAAWKDAKAPGKWKANIIFYFGLVCIGYWFINGFHFYDYITFYFFCSLWGYFFFRTAESSQTTNAMQMLVDNPELFEQAIADNKIMIIHKDIEDNKKAEEMNQEQASTFLDNGRKKYERGDYNGAIIEFSNSIKIYPFVSAFGDRAVAKLKLKDYEGAILDYTEAINRMPSIPNKNSFANYYRNRGEAKKALNLLAEAKLDFIEEEKLRSK